MSTLAEKKYHNVHQELVDLCMVHDEAAQREIYKLYYKAMYNNALGIVKDKFLAEDVMQNAFLKAFKKIHTYNNTSSFGAWLKRIVINEAINCYRKQKPEFSTNDVYTLEQPFESNESTEFRDWKHQSIHLVRKKMNELNDRYYQVLNLVLLEGYDLQEVSEIMNISYSNARVLYMRAKNKLQALVFEEK